MGRCCSSRIWSKPHITQHTVRQYTHVRLPARFQAVQHSLCTQFLHVPHLKIGLPASITSKHTAHGSSKALSAAGPIGLEGPAAALLRSRLQKRTWSRSISSALSVSGSPFTRSRKILESSCSAVIASSSMSFLRRPNVKHALSTCLQTRSFRFFASKQLHFIGAPTEFGTQMV